MILRLLWRSLLARLLTVSLTVLAIALSVALFLAVETIRSAAKDSFTDTISGTDLIIGARSGSVQLLLYSVFQIGNATNNISWESYQQIIQRPEVDWSVPISLGDSHKQFRVMGTSEQFFSKYKYRSGRQLQFQQGRSFADLYDTVIGHDVAQALGYQLGEAIVIAHGLASFVEHDDQPFKVSGILAKTGTPVDRSVIVSLEAIEAIHVDWRSGARKPGTPTAVATIRQMDLRPRAITAALIGTKSRLQIFALQRIINQYPQEPLLAIIPAVALHELWQIVAVAETALLAVAAMVVLTALLGMMAIVFASLNERRRELAIWRAMGARPRVILGMLALEGVIMALLGVILAVLIWYLGLLLAHGWLDANYGIWLEIGYPGWRELQVLLAVIISAALASLLPAWRAYRMSLVDGMMVKI